MENIFVSWHLDRVLHTLEQIQYFIDVVVIFVVVLFASRQLNPYPNTFMFLFCLSFCFSFASCYALTDFILVFGWMSFTSNSEVKMLIDVKCSATLHVWIETCQIHNKTYLRHLRLVLTSTVSPNYKYSDYAGYTMKFNSTSTCYLLCSSIYDMRGVNGSFGHPWMMWICIHCSWHQWNLIGDRKIRLSKYKWFLVHLFFPFLFSE